MRRPVSKFAIPCTALAVLLSPLAMMAQASATTDLRYDYETVSRLVKFADLNLNDPKAVVTLYERITTAADSVCEPVNSRIIETQAHIRHCQREAIAQAVRDVNSSSLTSYYMTATNRVTFTVVR